MSAEFASGNLQARIFLMNSMEHREGFLVLHQSPSQRCNASPHGQYKGTLSST